MTGDAGLQRIIDRLAHRLARDALVQTTLEKTRSQLQIDRVVLYYFYRRWKGQVTAEALSTQALSIYGSTGADDCFNDNYAQLYLHGRVRAIGDIETAGLDPCHRDFLRSLDIKANLVAPILTENGLWGLIAAHHCQAPRDWSQRDIEGVQQAAQVLATSNAIATP